jgi:hypothetical protein
MPSTYIDSLAYLKQPTGLTLTSYVGNNARLASLASAGATSLTVVAGQAPLSMYDSIYIFDGPNSEIVQAGSDIAPGVGTYPLLSATQYQHAAGTVYCTDGLSGSLGEQIFIASRWIEDNICHQALWSTPYTGEILTTPTMRAAWDNQSNLHFRPRHFPVSALTSVLVMVNQQITWNYDPTQAIIDSDQQTVDLPQIALLQSGGNSPSQVFTGRPWYPPSSMRQMTAWITIAYTAGFAVGALPAPITRACALLTSEMFSQLVNPVGADQINQGKRSVVFMIRGDTSGESLLVKQATKLLQPYVAESF